MSETSFGDNIKAVAIEAAKLAGVAAFSALAVAPHAANHAVETTTVHTQVAEFPTDLSYYPGVSKVNFLNLGNVYSDKTVNDVGLSAKVTGLPRFASVNDAVAYLSPTQLDIYASMADSPDVVLKGYKKEMGEATKQNLLDFELQWGGLLTAGIYGGLAAYGWRRKLHELQGNQTFELSAALLLGSAAIGLAASYTVADATHKQWLESAPTPDNLSVINTLNGTSLEGTQTDNPSLIHSVDTGVKYALKLKERRSEERETYLERVEPQVAAQLQALPDLRENEVLIGVITDEHASKAGLEINRLALSTLQERYGADKVQTQLDLGDLSQAADFQRAAVVEQANVGKGITQVLTPGNHDTSKVKGWLEGTAFQITNGYTKVNDLTVYGQPDVQETPFLQASSFPGDIKSETELGEQVAADLAQQPADVLDLHQPTALGSALGIEDITDELNSPEHTDLTECDFEGMGEGNDEAPKVALANAGHWHDQYPLKTYCFKDGEWTVLNVQGSAGGANETPTANDWSDPDGVPVKDITERVFVYNTKYGSVTGAIDIVVTPQGIVQPIRRVDIGTPDGSPFITGLSADSKKPRGGMTTQERSGIR